jgi:serine-type D-Ala-D-Ala carboxypeptidase (penicillin-binding protein 5/6)
MCRRPTLAILVVAAALLASVASVASAPGASAAPRAPAAPATTVPSGWDSFPAGTPHPRSDIVVDAQNGRILYGDNIHAPLPPASTAKLFTALAAVERLAPDAPVTADPAAASVEENRIGFHNGQTWPLNEMLAALMMVSANDAAYSIAHTVAGSLDNFATDLNELAHRLGARNSTLGDPAGLDDKTSYKGGPITSAYDLSIAARNALAVPEIAKWASMQSYQFADPQGVHHDLENHNKMLQQGSPYYFLGMTGFKTGFTQRAQHTFVGTATRNGRSLIVVVMGAVTPGYVEAKSLLDAGFATNAATGAGPTLPPPSVSLYAARQSDRDAFVNLGRAPASGATAGTAAPTKVVSDVPASIEISRAPRAATPVVAPKSTSTHHSSLFSLRYTLILLIVLGLAALFLRRRAVRRRRTRRTARRKQRLAAMRSGGLPIVDGRYRAGTRLGQPLESHVRVRRIEDETSAIDTDLALDA